MHHDSPPLAVHYFYRYVHKRPYGCENLHHPSTLIREDYRLALRHALSDESWGAQSQARGLATDLVEQQWRRTATAASS
jgi:hypothetical protein